MQRYNLSEPLPKTLEVCGVYMIQIGWHVYIGSAQNIRTRILGHRKALRKGHHIHRLQEQYNTYGESEVFVSVLKVCDEEHLLEEEEFWINALPSDMNIQNEPTRHPIYKPWNHPGISKEVHRYTLSGDYIDSFPSVKEAQRQLRVKSSVLIAAAANPNNVVFKSAYGYQWSYIKQQKLSMYINHSADAKKVSVVLTDISTGKEYEFNSIAEAVRTLFPNCTEFNSLCATVSSVAKGKVKTVKGKYTAKYK